MPTKAQPNIWYGIQGPTPPVMRAEAKSEVQPRVKPKPGPKTRPAGTRTKKTVSMPAVPAPRERMAALTAEEDAQHGQSLGVDPDSGDLGDDHGQEPNFPAR